jgi:hypothetical protein
MVGTIVLGAALLMLVAGQTVLPRKLHGGVYLIYWLVCLVLTGGAILIALADARATSHELKRQQRELLDQTLKDIQTQAKTKDPRQRRRPPPGQR